ncbi:cache domain-containing protein [Lyngbya sp. CCY1209]|uniref:cache domain-containing protein n=1 Tax=Lyngbya sp. CCY1209 TaxID=2886103 RepID=UPI002D20688F|nr:cache domain-containing protein [Lyngbya sp. CCY1209]MEB3885416.1 cache domain-containing protein [Lyngbya sp. CCY1209]
MASNPSTDYMMHFHGIDVRGNRRFFLEEVAPYDPRLRPWYKVAIAAGQPTWSPVYLDFTTKLPTVTASIPVYEKWGYRLLGVCGADVLLSEELRQFLNNLQIGESGQAFIFHGAD